MDDVCLVSTTVDAREAAESLAASAVTVRLAARAQVSGPVRSIYWSHGRVATSVEWVVQFRTPADRAKALVAHVRAIHPDELPEVLVTPVTGGNPDYLAWVHEETRD